jgi:hypothetical protein
MWDYVKLIVLALIAVLAAIAASYAHDLPYMVNALVVMLAAAITFVWQLRHVGEPAHHPQNEYLDGVVRAGVIATTFWGVVGFLVGVIIAFQLAFPALNLGHVTEGILNFGRLRPLHTSAVIFAFGGNALIMSAFYVVQRTTAARLWGGNLAWFVFWGWQLMIVLAATSYILGGTQSKEYAEPSGTSTGGSWWSGSPSWAYLHGHAHQAQGTPYLRGQLVLPVVHRDHRDAAHGQQPGDPGVDLRLVAVGAGHRRRAGCHGAVVVRPQRRGLLPDRRLPWHDVLLRARSRPNARSSATSCRSSTSGR